jgi:hypothetical protein
MWHYLEELCDKWINISRTGSTVQVVEHLPKALSSMPVPPNVGGVCVYVCPQHYQTERFKNI